MKFIPIKTDEEIANLVNIASEIWHEYWTDILSISQIDYMLKKFQSNTAIKIQIEEERYIYNIFSDENNIIGYFGVSVKEDYLFLSKLYIKNEFRGLGCGKLAFNKIKQIAQQYNKHTIHLTVNKNNVNTIEVYKKWNFKIVDSVVTDIGSGFVMDDYIMECSL